MSEGHTTVTLQDAEREQLAEYEHGDHYRVGEAVDMLMSLVPSPDKIRDDGCRNCGTPPANDPLDKQNGIIMHEYTYLQDRDEPWQFAYWFCSLECAHEWDEERRNMVPHNPDKVVVGGRDEFRTTMHDATFHMDEQTKQVGFDVPGAFTGEAQHSGEYAYIGEPVWVYADGKVRQAGVIQEIIHEEAHTTLDLDWSYAVPQAYHPDESVVAEFFDEYRVGTHDGCGGLVSQPLETEDEVPLRCEACNDAVDPEAVTEITDPDDLP